MLNPIFISLLLKRQLFVLVLKSVRATDSLQTVAQDYQLVRFVIRFLSFLDVRYFKNVFLSFKLIYKYHATNRKTYKANITIHKQVSYNRLFKLKKQ